MPSPFNDQALQTFSINDFTSGINRWAQTNAPPSYAPFAPPGSAAHAYRCIGRQGIGLMPLPTYTTVQTFSELAGSTPLCLSLGNMMTLTQRGGATCDIVAAWLVQHDQGISATTDFIITRDQPPVASAIVYNSTSTGAFPTNTLQWPTMDHGVFQDQTTSAFARTVITTDPNYTSFATTPTSGQGRWVTVRGWTTPTSTTAPDSLSGPFNMIGLIGAYPRIFYHEARMMIWQIGAALTTPGGFVQSDADVLFVSNHPTTGNPGGTLDPSAISQAGTFFPEMGTMIGTWGSWSAGELVGIYHEGGGFILNGDPMSSSLSAYKLTGLMGTNGAIGRAALTPIGMIYCRYNEGVYVWNGDNSCQEISKQVPDGVFTRIPLTPGFMGVGAGAMSQEAWGEWVMFPNNWLFDTATQSWWLCEDPNILNMQVWANGNTYMVSSPGTAYADPGEVASVNIYKWSKQSAATTYFWQSNPVPMTVGALVTIMSVEIVASNLTPTPARITIQPVSPTQPFLSDPLPNNNNSIVTFDIPPYSNAWRATKRMGYSDYNVQLAVTASNLGDNGAPTLHTINCSYAPTRTSGIQ